MEIQKTPRVKCIIGLIYSPSSDLHACLQHLQHVFGRADMISGVYPFDITDYYEPEMGTQLLRRFVSFDKLVEAQTLPEIKRLTNVMETAYVSESGRSINLDPGYMDMDKFILASAKYGRQKIYLDKGIYADPTLYYYKKEFQPYEWSFPDFKSGIYNDYFLRVRSHYKKQIRDL